MRISFTLEGRPLGYYAQAARSKWLMSPKQRARAEKYRAWQKWVQQEYQLHRLRVIRFTTDRAAVPPPLPFVATEASPLTIETRCYFEDHRHPDPENVHKGIVDSLFRNSPTGDRYVAGSFRLPTYDKERPRVEVDIVVWGSGDEICL